MNEDYVSFATAKLLKEKGFDEECNMAYFNGTLVDYTMFGFCLGGDLLYCPTLQKAMKWLRKWHNLHCDVGYDFRLGWHIQITSLKEIVQDHDTEMKTYLPNKAVNYPSYEEACEEAIRYCLENLI